MNSIDRQERGSLDEKSFDSSLQKNAAGKYQTTTVNPNSKRSQKLSSAGSNVPGNVVSNQVLNTGTSSTRRKGGSQGKTFMT
jgi:hypothetical protein